MKKNGLNEIEDTKAIVVFQGKDSWKVQQGNQRILLARITGKLRNQVIQRSDLPVVDDWVKGKIIDEHQFLIEEVCPRISFLQRKVAGNRQDQQGIAANIETVFITTSVNKEFNKSRLERLATIVWDSGANPVFILNKIDIAAASEVVKKKLELENFFLGIPILTTSIYQENHEKFDGYLKENAIVAFIGSSGVGKSSLINQLLGEATQATNEIRAEDAHGRHTTTSRQLFTLPNGARLIDTPGIREIGLETMHANAFDQQYKEIYRLAKECRFSNCRHLSEPDCAVKKALAHGTLSQELLVSYRKMEAQIAYLQKKEKKVAMLKKKRR